MKNQVTNNSRRDFLKESLLLGGSILFLPTAFAHTVAETLPGRLSRQIMIDQAIALAIESPQAGQQLKELLMPDLHQHLSGNVARIGWTFPMQKERIMQLIETAKADYTSANPSEYALEKAALALGAVAAWPIVQLKPATNEEAALYQDAAMLKHLNGKQPAEKIKGKAEDLALLFKEMVPRAHTRMHTLIPDDDDAQAWILRVDKWRSNNDVYFNQLATAYMNPDKKLVKKYVVDTNFYKPDLKNCESMGAIKTGEKYILFVKKYLDGKLSKVEIESLLMSSIK